MLSNPILLAAFSSLLAIGAFGSYLSTIPRRKVAEVPTNSMVALFVSLAGFVVAVAQAFRGGASPVLTLVVGTFAWVLPLLFAVLFLSRKTPLGKIQVSVGDKLLPFTAQLEDGTVFDSADLAGRRVLLKFFRGQWCSYCSAELRHFEQLRPQIEAKGVTIVALSKDTPEDVVKQRTRDKLGFQLLSDPELKVIRQYGVEHHKALEFSTGSFTIAGMPLALVPSVRETAIPTTLLIDEHGVVRWIDQAEDYRIRSGEARVLDAINAAFAAFAA